LLPSRIVAGINLPLTVFADFHFIGNALFTTESRRRRGTAKPEISKACNRKVRKELPLRTAKKTGRISEAGNQKERWPPLHSVAPASRRLSGGRPARLS
jgi:hypothetical protein